MSFSETGRGRGESEKIPAEKSAAVELMQDGAMREAVKDLYEKKQVNSALASFEEYEAAKARISAGVANEEDSAEVQSIEAGARDEAGTRTIQKIFKAEGAEFLVTWLRAQMSTLADHLNYESYGKHPADEGSDGSENGYIQLDSDAFLVFSKDRNGEVVWTDRSIVSSAELEEMKRQEE